MMHIRISFFKSAWLSLKVPPQIKVTVRHHGMDSKIPWCQQKALSHTTSERDKCEYLSPSCQPPKGSSRTEVLNPMRTTALHRGKISHSPGMMRRRSLPWPQDKLCLRISPCGQGKLHKRSWAPPAQFLPGCKASRAQLGSPHSHGETAQVQSGCWATPVQFAPQTR